MPTDRVPEAVLSRIWNEGWHSRELRTTAGRRVGVVYRGVWTHSNGPDFRDAMLEIDGRLVQGSVELHVRSSDWEAHGHEFDPAYDAVVLHVVLDHDAARPASGPNGAPIPTVSILPFLHGAIEDFTANVVPVDLGGIGTRVCLPTLAGERPDEIRAVLRREGWRRLHEKQLRFQQEMVIRPPAEVLYRGMLDSLGLTGNRNGMAAVADILPLGLAERIAGELRWTGIVTALLGVAGFLPLTPGSRALLGDVPESLTSLDETWDELSAGYGLHEVPAASWNLNRVRPLNHPLRRLASMASLLSATSADGLLARLLPLPVDSGQSWDGWLSSAEPAIGLSRRRQIIVNTIAPFLAAYADAIGDEALVERVSECWERLAGSVDDDFSRKTLRQITGKRRFPVTTALEVQGLHQIGRHGCIHLRCFECPIAALAVTFESPPPVS